MDSRTQEETEIVELKDLANNNHAWKLVLEHIDNKIKLFDEYLQEPENLHMLESYRTTLALRKAYSLLKLMPQLLIELRTRSTADNSIDPYPTS